MSPGADDTAPRNPADIRAALDRICGTSKFKACPRLTSFLRFVVEAALEGRRSQLKGYTIGVEALGRRASFDPQIDPIVRVEATRLRRALAKHYAGEGAGDPLVIDIPRGHYVPTFRLRVSISSAAPPTWRQILQTIQRGLRSRLAIVPPSDLR